MFRALVLVFVVISSTFCYPRQNEETIFIVNGTNAKEGEFPYIVSLRSSLSDLHSCGGSIISPDWILTAAHCIGDHTYTFKLNVQYGVTEISQDEKRNSVDPAEYIIHEEYDSTNNANDIGLLKLKTPLEFNKFVQPVKLPKQGQETPANSSAILIGWGRNRSGGSIQKHLQKVKLITFSDEDCYNRDYRLTFPTNICAGVPEGGKGQCNGDSGGPLIVDGVQVGIVSWSIKPCAIPPYLGVLTKVSSFINWIEEKTKLKLHE